MKSDIYKSLLNNYNFSSINFTILCLFIFTFYSCDDKLSRDEAEKQIKANLVNTENVNFSISAQCSSCDETQRRFWEKLHDSGLIVVYWYDNDYRFEGMNGWHLTEVGRKYVVSENIGKYNRTTLICKTSEIKFDKIIGITQQKGSNEASVKYSKIRTITPYGRAITLQDGKFEENQIFTRYDDGWKIGK